MLRAKNGALVTIAGPGTSPAGIGPLSMAYEPSINNNDVVTFTGNRADTGAGVLFTGAGGALTTISFDNLSCSMASTTLAVWHFLATLAVQTGDGGPVTTIATRTFEGGAYESFTGGGAQSARPARWRSRPSCRQACSACSRAGSRSRRRPQDGRPLSCLGLSGQ